MNWLLSSWRVSTCGHQRAFNVLACSLRSTAHGDAAFGCRFAVLIGDIRRHSPRSCRGSPPVPRFASCGQADAVGERVMGHTHPLVHLCLGSRLVDKRMCVTHYSLSYGCIHPPPS